MAVPNIRIDIASVFKEKGFKDASKASSGLETQFKRLGKTFLTVFSAAAIVKFGKDSVRAFANEEKAVKKLEQTLKGVNLGFTAPAVEAYLKRLEESTFVTDDLLRPALEKLIRTTGSVSASQDILATAIDMAAGSGFDLVTVADDLGRAYLGNARGLSKYNTTLTRTDLQTKSFADIQKVLNEQFSGQRSAFLTTYAGKLEMIDTAYGRMQESIGEGLVDAFGMLAGEQGIAGATSAMEEFGTITADVIRGVGSLVGNLTAQVGGKGGLQSFIDLAAKTNNPLGRAIKSLQELGKQSRGLMFPTLGVGQPGYAAQQKKIEEEARKRAAAAEKLRQKEIKQKKEIERLKKISNALDKASKMFDEKRISLAAALQGRLTKVEKNRVDQLLLIEDIQEAIKNKEVKRAEELYAELLKLQGQHEKLVIAQNTIAATNPMPVLTGTANNAAAALGKVNEQIVDLTDEQHVIKIDLNTAELLAGVAKVKAALGVYQAQVSTALSPLYNNPVFDKSIVSGLNINQKRMIDEYIRSGRTDTLFDPVNPDVDLMAVIAGIQQREAIYSSARTAYKNIIPPADLASSTEELFGLLGTTTSEAMGTASTVVNVTVQGSVITENDLANTLTNLQLNQQRAGGSTLYSARAI
jgi:hypothetical protein